MIGIYKITNLVNGKVYIGQSVDIECRWRKETTGCFNKNYPEYNTPKCRAFRKYGLNSFSFEIIEQCNIDELNDKESFWAEYYNSYRPFGYNVAVCGKQHVIYNKLNFQSIREIKNRIINTRDSFMKIAEDFNVHYNTISAINCGRSWVEGGVEYPLRKKISKIKESRSRAAPMPSKENLVSVLISTRSKTQTAKIFKAAKKTIRKWISIYNIQETEWQNQ